MVTIKRPNGTMVWINHVDFASDFIGMLAVCASSLNDGTVVKVPCEVADRTAVVGNALEAQRLLGVVTNQQHHNHGTAVKAANEL